jgi:plastocyanin
LGKEGEPKSLPAPVGAAGTKPTFRGLLAPEEKFKRRMRMKTTSRIFYIAAATILALTTLPTVETPLAAAPLAAEVKIDNFSFTPATLTVKVGTQITWTNADDIPHTVVSADQAFKSKALDTDGKFTFTADKPGTYSYFCSIHPKMTGKVIVE